MPTHPGMALLPQNTTSCLQPLDAGFIQTFKLTACIDSCSSASEVSTGVTVLNVVTWIDKA